MPEGNPQRSRVFATQSADGPPRELVWQVEKLFRLRFSESFSTRIGSGILIGELPTGQSFTRPLISGSTIFFSTYQEDAYFYAIDAATGKQIVMLKFADNALSALAAAGPVAIFGTWKGKVNAYDAVSQKLKWGFEENDTSFASAEGGAVGDLVLFKSLVIFGEEYKDLVALDARTDLEKWRFKTKKRCRDPLIADATLYARCNDHYLYAIDAESGALKWNIDSKGSGMTPMIAGGVMYSLSFDGVLQAFR